MHSSRDRPAPDAVILVAEDDPTNRDIIKRQLARLGYRCETAEDGSRALEMWRTGSYALLLADVQMPALDGLELTAAVRQCEASGAARTPIIAISATALNAEPARFLSAGMDDCLSKPIAMAELRGMLEKWLGRGEPRAADSADHVSAGLSSQRHDGEGHHSEPIDRRVLEGLFGKDPDTFREIVREFLPAAQEIVEQIRSGRTEGSAEKVQAAAHKLKSSARSAGALRLADAAVTLEAAARDGDWGAIDEGVSSLTDLMRQVEVFVEGL